jgi:hypothetical protein
MRICFTEPRRIILALLAGMLFAFLTACSSTHMTPLPVVVATSGGGQSTVVNTEFGEPFVATVTINGQPATGVSVVFTATSEPGCTFANETNTETDVTDSTGTATSSVCTADTTAGAYNVTATTLPAAGDSFSVSNTSGPPDSISVGSGTPQSTEEDSAFADPLVANVVDVYQNPVAGASVTFTAPASGASGTFANGTKTETDVTDANGNATTSTFTANTTIGGPYKVKGVLTGFPALTFSLTNTD